MKKWQSFTALKTVKSEIENLSIGLSNALETVIVTPSDEKKELRPLNTPVKQFIQVAGTLRLLDFQNLALLADEIVCLLVETIKNAKKVDESETALRLEQAFIATNDLPALLENAIRYSADPFINVVRQINLLRKTRSAAIIFSHDVLTDKSRVNFRSQFQTKPEKMQDLLSKQAGYFQKVCKALTQDSNNTEACNTLRGVIHNLELVFRDHKIGVLWGLANGLTELIVEQSSERKEIIALIASLEPELLESTKLNKELGDKTINEDILAKMLDKIAMSKLDNPRIEIIKLWYNLDLSANKSFREQYTHIQVSYLNKSAISKSLLLINEEMKRMMDSINTFSEEGNTEPEQLQTLYTQIFQLKGVLEVLRINYLAELIDSELTTVPGENFEQSMSAAAKTMYKVSSELKTKLDIMEHDMFLNEQIITGETKLNSAVLNILLTSIRSMESVISGLDQYIDNDCNADDLNDIEKTVDDVACVLETVPLKALAGQLFTARAFFSYLKNIRTVYTPDENFEAISQLVINVKWNLDQLVLGREDNISHYLEKGEQKALKVREFLALQEPIESTETTTKEKLTVISNMHLEEDAKGTTDNIEDTDNEQVAISASSDSAILEVDDDIKEIFIEEFEDVCIDLKKTLAELHNNPHSKDMLKDCCRSFHTLKGSGNMINASHISQLCMKLENLFDHLYAYPGTSSLAILEFTGEILEFLPVLKEAFVTNKFSSEIINNIDSYCQQADQFITGQSEQELEQPQSTDADAIVLEPGSSVIDETKQEDILSADASVDLTSDLDTATDKEHQDNIPVYENLQVDSELDITSSASTLNESTLKNDETVLSESTETFCHELAELTEKIRLTITETDDNALHLANTSDLLIPVHTIYGNARLEQLENYSNAVLEMEKFLQKHPYKILSSNIVDAFDIFCTLSDKLIQEVKETHIITEYEGINTDTLNLKNALDNLSSEWINPQSDEILTTFTAEDGSAFTQEPGDINGEIDSIPAVEAKASVEPQTVQELVLSGFMNEARELSAKLHINLSELLDSNNREVVNSIVDTLELLQGAADIAGIHPIEETCAILQDCYKIYQDPDSQFTNTATDILRSAQQYIEQSIILLDKDELPVSAPEIIVSLQNLLKAEQSVEDDVDPELLAVFLEEADELLHDLDECFLQWQESPQENAHINEYLRLLHTIKGSAALVGEKQLSTAAHDYETFIVNTQNNNNDFSEQFFNECDSRLHALHDIYRLYEKDEQGKYVKSQMQAQKPVDNIDTEIVATPVREDSPRIPQPETKVEGVPEVNLENISPLLNAEVNTEIPKKNKSDNITANSDEQIKVSSQLLRSLLNDADEINFSRSRIEKDFHDMTSLLVDMDDTLNRLKSYVNKFEENSRPEMVCSIDSELNQDKQKISDDFDALEMDRYTELQEISLSLTEDYDDLQDIRMNLSGKIKEIDNVLLGQQRLTNSLQDGLISSQMVPFASVSPRLRRLVRQVSRDLNKDVSFSVENQQGNMDKNVLQAVITPLEHILRNAIDHGLETPEERIASGKDKKANLTIKVARLGASITIEIRDDGRGINIDKVKEKAIQKGLLKQDAEVSRQEIYQIMFSPGFSTSDSVSNISGRGVGLDVVKSDISHIGGHIDVNSRQGVGTAFTIRLPLTSSLNRALLFEIQDTRYVVLMNTLDGVLVEKLASIHQKQLQEEHPQFEYNDGTYEYLYLGALLNENFKPKLDSIDTAIPLLLVGGKEKNYALHIDSIVESRDLVVKSFGKQFASMPGVSGGVIMPDGNVAIVLDLRSLVNLYSTDSLPVLDSAISLAGRVKESDKGKLVMVVDDSITVRKITSTILKRNGMQVITAKNGVEAIEYLSTQTPDLILLDIEMPKMDGFEVASYIRNQEAPIKDIPIIMITSRIGDKHRTRAEEIGVNEYLCKPFQEDSLLEHISNY